MEGTSAKHLEGIECEGASERTIQAAVMSELSTKECRQSTSISSPPGLTSWAKENLLLMLRGRKSTYRQCCFDHISWMCLHPLSVHPRLLWPLSAWKAFLTLSLWEQLFGSDCEGMETRLFSLK
eukprot:1151715-Pelagomonas_calceolata.AAC.5